MIHKFQKKIPQLAQDVFIALGAHVIGEVDLGSQSSVWFNTVIRGDVFAVKIGARTNIQDNSVIHVTDGQYGTTIGEEVTVGHRVILHGCTVQDRALIGMGSIILDGALIGEEALVGAGSLVPPKMQIPPRVLAFGSPCKVVRQLKDHEIQFLKASALHYVDLAAQYLKTSDQVDS